MENKLRVRDLTISFRTTNGKVQAVRGINVFNFMTMSYEKKGILPFQYRPSFIPENPGCECLSEINGYTARLSYLMRSGNAVIDTALYYPFRTICAGGEEAEKAKAKAAEAKAKAEKARKAAEEIKTDKAEKAAQEAEKEAKEAEKEAEKDEAIAEQTEKEANNK